MLVAITTSTANPRKPLPHSTVVSTTQFIDQGSKRPDFIKQASVTMGVLEEDNIELTTLGQSMLPDEPREQNVDQFHKVLQESNITRAIHVEDMDEKRVVQEKDEKKEKEQRNV